MKPFHYSIMNTSQNLRYDMVVNPCNRYALCLPILKKYTNMDFFPVDFESSRRLHVYSYRRQIAKSSGENRTLKSILWNVPWLPLRILYWNIFRRLYKWTVRVIFRRGSELWRIHYYSLNNSQSLRTIQFENSLRVSKTPALFHAVNRIGDVALNRFVEGISRIKHVPPPSRISFEADLAASLRRIIAYTALVDAANRLRAIPYDSQNADHEAMLMRLWNSLKPGHPLSERVTRQWEEIGFQGRDPATDFRAMGLLGLTQLLYIVEKMPDVACKLVDNGNLPRTGYSFAVTGITMTAIALQLLRNGALKWDLYALAEAPALSHFHDVYCRLYVEWDAFWEAARPANVMAFGEVTRAFLAQYTRQLLRRERTELSLFM